MNILPLLLLGGGAVYLVTAKKNGKNGKKAAKKVTTIDKGTYKYSSDCKHIWVAGKDLTDSKVIFKNEDQVAVTAFAKFVEPAVSQAISEMGASPMPLIESSVRAIAKLMPECAFTKGKPAPKAALGLMPMVMSFAANQVAEKMGWNMATFMEDMRKEMYLMTQTPGFAKQEVDLVALIHRERENPTKVEVPAGFDPETMGW